VWYRVHVSAVVLSVVLIGKASCICVQLCISCCAGVCCVLAREGFLHSDTQSCASSVVLVSAVCLQAQLQAAEVRAAGLESDLCARTAKSSTLEQQVQELGAEVTEWRSR
jgi:hypothetical protein